MTPKFLCNVDSNICRDKNTTEQKVIENHFAIVYFQIRSHFRVHTEAAAAAAVKRKTIRRATRPLQVTTQDNYPSSEVT